MDSRDEPPWQLTDFISSPQWGVDTVLNNPPKIQATHSCTKSVFRVSAENFLTTPPQLLFTQGETKLSIERLNHQHVAWRASGCLHKYTEGERKKKRKEGMYHCSLHHHTMPSFSNSISLAMTVKLFHVVLQSCSSILNIWPKTHPSSSHSSWHYIRSSKCTKASEMSQVESQTTCNEMINTSQNCLQN